MAMNREQLKEVIRLVKIESEVETLLKSEVIQIIGTSKDHEGIWREDDRCVPDKSNIMAFLTDYRDLLRGRLAELGLKED